MESHSLIRRIRGILFVLVIIVSIIIHFHISRINASFYQTEEIEPLKNSYVVHDPILIRGDGDFTEFPGTGTKEDPYLIENYYIGSISDSVGINISATNSYFVIRNCYINVLDYGIWISWISHGTAQIINNTCISNNVNGIDLWDASGTILANNTLISNGDGLSVIASDDVSVTSNNCSYNNQIGISVKFVDNASLEDNYCINNNIGMDVDFSRNVKVSDNIFIQNFITGISLSNSFTSFFLNNKISKNQEEGIALEDSENIILSTNNLSLNKNGITSIGLRNSQIYNNTIKSNINRGISLVLSDGNLITYNHIENHTGYGIHANLTSQNSIHHNNFINNNIGGISQAYSRDGINNTWYSPETKEGNFWDNWLGVGLYLIEGFSGSYDIYPLENPVSPPQVIEPFERKPYFIYLITIFPSLIFIALGVYIYLIIRQRRRTIKSEPAKRTLEYIEQKRKIAYSDKVGIGFFRFGEKGGELIQENFRSIEVDLDIFIGFCYATIGQGQRYETGVYGQLPAPTLEDHNVIIFSFWGLDDIKSDPRLEGKQYYLVTLIYPVEFNKHLIRIETMNQKFRNYIKKYKYPNRITLEELNHFREIVFI
jgi:parallel beta-helix repeat protein